MPSICAWNLHPGNHRNIFLDYNRNCTLATNDFIKNTLSFHLMFKENKAYTLELAYDIYNLVIRVCMIMLRINGTMQPILF